MNPPGTQAVRPLTVLSDEETLFRATVRDYAETIIAPLVSRMDEEAQYDPALLPGLFELGVMGEVDELFPTLAKEVLHLIAAVAEGRGWN